MGPHGGPGAQKRIRSQKFGVVRLRYRASFETSTTSVDGSKNTKKSRKKRFVFEKNAKNAKNAQKIKITKKKEGDPRLIGTQALVPISPGATVEKHFLSPTSNGLYSISFVKTSAPGGLPSPRTAVLTDFLKRSPQK